MMGRKMRGVGLEYIASGAGILGIVGDRSWSTPRFALSGDTIDHTLRTMKARILLSRIQAAISGVIRQRAVSIDLPVVSRPISSRAWT